MQSFLGAIYIARWVFLTQFLCTIPAWSSAGMLVSYTGEIMQYNLSTGGISSALTHISASESDAEL